MQCNSVHLLPSLCVCSIILSRCQLPGLHMHDVQQTLPCLSVCAAWSPLPVLTAAIPVTVVAAASFDDMIAITGYTLFINLVSVAGLHAHSTVSRPANTRRVPAPAFTVCTCTRHAFCHLYGGQCACCPRAPFPSALLSINSFLDG